MKAFERSRAESGMQPKRYVRGQFGFMVPKLEEHSQFVVVDAVGQIYADFQRILAWRKILRSNPIFQRSAAALAGESRETPCHGAKEPVISSFDFATPVKT